MTILFWECVLLGAVFGRFFKAWVLVPACAVTFVTVFASSTFYGHGFLEAVLAFATLSTCLQIGYASVLLPFIIAGMWRRLRNPRQIRRFFPWEILAIKAP